MDTNWTTTRSVGSVVETWSNGLIHAPEMIVQSLLFFVTGDVESRISTRSDVSQFEASVVQPAKEFFLNTGAP